MQSESIDQLATALAAAQGMMKNPVKKKTARIKSDKGSYEYKYADLAETFDVIRDPLSKNGLSVTQTMERVLVGDAQGTNFFLATTLRHKSGQWVSSYYPLPVGAKPQEFGSVLTYARRYSLSAIVGIASDEDDDANEAQKIEVAPRKPEVAKAVELSIRQIEDIRLYTSELDVDRITKFLAWLNVKSLDDIKAHQYERAMAGLRKAVGRSLGSNTEDAVPTDAPEAVRG